MLQVIAPVVLQVVVGLQEILSLVLRVIVRLVLQVSAPRPLSRRRGAPRRRAPPPAGESFVFSFTGNCRFTSNCIFSLTSTCRSTNNCIFSFTSNRQVGFTSSRPPSPQQTEKALPAERERKRERERGGGRERERQTERKERPLLH